jgi:hypothetical protein
VARTQQAEPRGEEAIEIANGGNLLCNNGHTFSLSIIVAFGNYMDVVVNGSTLFVRLIGILRGLETSEDQ